MSSKQFRGKLCVYCCERSAVAGDHVFPRELFVERSRANLPQVPTCDLCNNQKSKLEHYLTTILPFGGRHADARENLVNLVPGRLARNLRLGRELNAGRRHVWWLQDGIFRPTMHYRLIPARFAHCSPTQRAHLPGISGAHTCRPRMTAKRCCSHALGRSTLPASSR